MFCPSCGTEIPEGSRFCIMCGSAVGPLATEPKGLRREASRWSPPGLLVIGGVFGVFAAAALAILAPLFLSSLWGGGENSNASPSGGLEVRTTGYSLDDLSSCSQGPCVSLGRTAGQSGAADVPLVVPNARSIERFTFEWTYDDSIFYVSDIQAGIFEPSATSQFSCSEPTLDPGNVRIDCSMSGSCSVGGTGILATLRVNPLKEGRTVFLRSEGAGANVTVTLYGCDSRGSVIEYRSLTIMNAEIFVSPSR